MLLAELEVWHTRPAVPTRRVALGHMVLPVDPAPGFGGLLLGSIVAAHLPGIDDDLVPDIHRLIGQVERGERIVQPRLRHRFQVDRHGLAVSRHRLVGEDDDISFDVHTIGTDLAQVLGAIYAAERLAPEYRRQIGPLLQKAAHWRGPIGSALIAHLAGSQTLTLEALADPRGWAMGILGFELGGKAPSKREVTAQFRIRMRDVHPDHGGAEHRRGQGDERPRRGPTRAVDEAGLIERIERTMARTDPAALSRRRVEPRSLEPAADGSRRSVVGRRPAARLPLPPRGAQGPRPGPEVDGLDPRRPRRDRPASGSRRDGRTVDGRPDDHDGRRRRRRRRARRPPRRADPDLLSAAPAGQARQPPGGAPAGDRRAVPVHLGHERPVRFARRTRTVDRDHPRPGRPTCGSSARATTSRGPTARSPTPPRRSSRQITGA